jgi:signal transduction histidine kinase
MPFPDRRGKVRCGLRLPPRTVRLRLTLLYGGLFLASGAGLLAIVYLLVATQFPGRYGTGSRVPADAQGTATTQTAPNGTLAEHAQQQAAQLHQLLIQSGVALAVMAVAAVGLGWLMAGRILRPLRAMTATTRHISEDNLHQRLAVPGPRDELKDLADTIDGLLTRLEAAFEAQRRFVANASHELRTPLTLERAIIEVALADPDATANSLRTTCQEVLAAGQQQERLIEALLTLARSQRGLDHREPVDVAAITAAVLRGRRAEAAGRGLRIVASLGSAVASGDPRLIERLMTNLIDNAIRHNVPHGTVRVSSDSRAGRTTVSVANTGPVVPPDQIERLLQPFQRHTTDRISEHDGLGLGLSIVAAIAKAHSAVLTVAPEHHGGLCIEVSFAVRPPVARLD